jgi:hypothetical protein
VIDIDQRHHFVMHDGKGEEIGIGDGRHADHDVMRTGAQTLDQVIALAVVKMGRHGLVVAALAQQLRHRRDHRGDRPDPDCRGDIERGGAACRQRHSRRW